MRVFRSPLGALLGLSLAISACGGSSTPDAPTITNFTGNYSGNYQITSCSDGSLTGFCAGGGFNVGRQLPITMSLGQNGTSVSGNVALGNITGNFQGTVNNFTTLSGTAPLTPLLSNGVE